MLATLKVTEAAVLSGVTVRDVNRAVDEGLLGAFPPRGDGRHISTLDCILIRFYFHTASRLTAEERLAVIKRVEPRLRALAPDAIASALTEDWTVPDDVLTINLTPFVRDTLRSLERLTEARAAVTVSPDVLGGIPVLKGTRVPVHDVAASLAAGYTRADVLAAYPTLSDDLLDLAVLYAEACPARGRPRGIALPSGAALVSERRVPRRRPAA
jgi:uncharacterized protein (DUF433 family)